MRLVDHEVRSLNVQDSLVLGDGSQVFIAQHLVVHLGHDAGGRAGHTGVSGGADAPRGGKRLLLQTFHAAPTGRPAAPLEARAHVERTDVRLGPAPAARASQRAVVSSSLGPLWAADRGWLQGPGAWGRNTAASAVTYTSIPQRISFPPPVAKTTSWQPRPSSAAMGGGGEKLTRIASSSGTEGGTLQSLQSSGTVPPTVPYQGVPSPYSLLSQDWLQEWSGGNHNSGPDNRPVGRMTALF